MRNKNYLNNGFRPTVDECIIYMKKLFDIKASVQEKHLCFNTISATFNINDDYKYLVLRAYQRLYRKLDEEYKKRICRLLPYVHASYIEEVRNAEMKYGKIKQTSMFESLGVGL